MRKTFAVVTEIADIIYYFIQRTMHWYIHVSNLYLHVHVLHEKSINTLYSPANLVTYIESITQIFPSKISTHGCKIFNNFVTDHYVTEFNEKKRKIMQRVYITNDEIVHL